MTSTVSLTPCLYLEPVLCEHYIQGNIKIITAKGGQHLMNSRPGDISPPSLARPSDAISSPLYSLRVIVALQIHELHRVSTKPRRRRHVRDEQKKNAGCDTNMIHLCREVSFSIYLVPTSLPCELAEAGAQAHASCAAE